MSILSDFKSRLKNHRLQPKEISMLADLIIIYYAVNRSWPTKAQLLTLWSEYNE